MNDQRIPITASQLLQDLKDGLTREAIGEKYGFNKAQVKRLFNNPALKNKKTHKVHQDPFILIDDVTVSSDFASEAAAEQAVEEEAETVVEEVIEEETTEEVPVAEQEEEIKESPNPFKE